MAGLESFSIEMNSVEMKNTPGIHTDPYVKLNVNDGNETQ